MYDLDHMLNGKGSRGHHQEMIRQAQRTQFAVKPASVKMTSSLRIVLVAIINLVLRSF